MDTWYTREVSKNGSKKERIASELGYEAGYEVGFEAGLNEAIVEAIRLSPYEELVTVLKRVLGTTFLPPGHPSGTSGLFLYLMPSCSNLDEEYLHKVLHS